MALVVYYSMNYFSTAEIFHFKGSGMLQGKDWLLRAEGGLSRSWAEGVGRLRGG